MVKKKPTKKKPTKRRPTYTKDSIKNLDLAFDLMLRKLDEQVKVGEVLDTKTGVIVAAIAVILSFAIPFLQEAAGLNFFTVGIGSVVLGLLIIAADSVQTGIYASPPSEDYLYSNEFFASTHVNGKNQILADIVDSYKRNHKSLHKRAKSFDLAVFAATIGIYVMVLGVMTFKLTDGAF